MLPILASLPALAAEVVVVDTYQGPFEVRPVVNGGLDARAVVTALTPHLPAVGACFHVSLVGFQPFHIPFTIDTAGKAGPTPGAREPVTPSTEACVRDVVLAAPYPPASAPSDVRLALTRAPQGEGPSSEAGAAQTGRWKTPEGSPDTSAAAPLGSNAGIGGAHGPEGVVQRGADPVILGALDRALVDAAVERDLPHLRYCYARVLRVDPSVAGELVVAFTVDEAGAVTSAAIERTTANTPSLEGCVTRVFSKRLRFPARQGGGVVTVRYPLVFRR